MRTITTVNIVVWSGDPFEPSSVAEHGFIEGREIEHDSRQLRLLERDKNLGGLAAQYWATRARDVPAKLGHPSAPMARALHPCCSRKKAQDDG